MIHCVVDRLLCVWSSGTGHICGLPSVSTQRTARDRMSKPTEIPRPCQNSSVARLGRDCEPRGVQKLGVMKLCFTPFLSKIMKGDDIHSSHRSVLSSQQVYFCFFYGHGYA